MKFIIVLKKLIYFLLSVLIILKNIMQIQYNILVVGNGGVGKTLFIDRFKKSKAYKESGLDITFTEANEVVSHKDNSYDMVIVVSSYDKSMDNIDVWKKSIKNVFNDIPCSVVVTKCDGIFYDKKPSNNWFEYYFCDIQVCHIEKYSLVHQTDSTNSSYYFFSRSVMGNNCWNIFGNLIKKMKPKSGKSNLINKLECDINSNYFNKVVEIMTEMKERLMNSELEKNKLEDEVKSLKQQLKTLKENIKDVLAEKK